VTQVQSNTKIPAVLMVEAAACQALGLQRAKEHGRVAMVDRNDGESRARP